MFTGIVQAKGTVASLEPREFGVRLVIDRTTWTPPGGYQPGHGDSICISGCCLTVVEADGKTLQFDVIAETLDKTKLGKLQPGSSVNLEPSVMPSQPLGGHFMQGHVDGVAEVVDVYAGEDEWRTTVKPPAGLMKYIIPKGSVAIDGISLTIASVEADRFTVALIPTTLDITTLGETKVGDVVNLECDILSKTIVHQLEQMFGDESAAEGVSAELLKKAGFLKG